MSTSQHRHPLPTPTQAFRLEIMTRIEALQEADDSERERLLAALELGERLLREFSGAGEPDP